MSAEKARALVIRTFPFGDSSAVVGLYTRELGKVRALAKGAWRPKSAFDGALDLLSACQVLLLRKSSGGLDLLTEACLERRFRVGGSMTAFHGGMHVAELLDALTADADPQPELFDVADATLHTLSIAPAGHAPTDGAVRAAIARFELAALALTGHAPALRHCAECRSPVGGAGRIAVGLLEVIAELLELLAGGGGGEAAIGLEAALLAGDVDLGDDAADAQFDAGLAWGRGRAIVLEIVHGGFKELAVHLVADGGNVAALLGTEDVARAADLQVAHGDLEAGAEH